METLFYPDSLLENYSYYLNVDKKSLYGDSIVWRYLSFLNFEKLLKCGLNFTSPRYYWQNKNWDKNECRHPKSLHKKLIEHNEEEFKSTFDNLDKIFFSCWHLNPFDSSLMYLAYGGRQNESLAIKSTVSNVINSNLHKELDVIPRKIEYGEDAWKKIQNDFYKYLKIVNVKGLEYGTDSGYNPLSPAFWKRENYSLESEVRFFLFPKPGTYSDLVLWDADSLEAPPSVPAFMKSAKTDFIKLIKEIKLSPYSDEAPLSLKIDQLLKEFKLDNLKISVSDINEWI